MGKTLWSVAGTIILSACAPQSAFNRGFISSELEERVGTSLPETSVVPAMEFPEPVSLEDGLSEAEAVAVALWNNADFHGDLAQLGVARADLLEAGLLPNPVLSLVFPGNTKLREGTLSFPIELLQRQSRITVATLDVERVANDLLQSGLGLARDVRVAHADLMFSQARYEFLSEDAEVLSEIAEIAEGQLQAGGISNLEASRIEADALSAMALVQVAAREAVVARYVLLRLLGLAEAQDIELTSEAPPEYTPLPELRTLVDIALASRPDLRAAELAVEAAGEAAEWESRQIYNFVAVLDLDQERGGDLKTGPGFEYGLPIFDRNQGGKQRATAQIEQAAFRYTAARRRIVLEVSESYAAYEAAREAARAWQEDIIPRLDETVNLTQQAFALGSAPELSVLLAQQSLTTARISEAEALAEFKRASAQLAHSAGQKVDEQI